MSNLKINNIIKEINNNKIVNNISINIKAGEIVGLLGANGAGKTTTFYIISGLIKTTSGSILLNNKDITNLSMSNRSQLGIGYLPQESTIFEDLTVYDNLWIAAEGNRNSKIVNSNRIEELLNIFNINRIKFKLGIELSGGEKRRVEIARSLVSKPKFLLLDEPFAGVDPISINDIKNIITTLISFNIGVLITDHNAKEVLSISNFIYIMNMGRILAKGTSQEIIKNREVSKYYLGSSLRNE